MEAEMKKKGFGIAGDASAEAIIKCFTPQIVPTHKLIARMGTTLRN